MELSWLNTSSCFCQKHNFFGAAKIHGVSTWHIKWLFPFTLSIPLDQPSVFTKSTVFIDSYNSILVIIDRLTKMVHYKPVKVTFDIPGLAEVIIDMVICHHGFLDSIVTNKGSLFTLKFWSLLCYFLGIKKRLFTTFYP